MASAKPTSDQLTDRSPLYWIYRGASRGARAPANPNTQLLLAILLLTEVILLLILILLIFSNTQLLLSLILILILLSC